MESGSLRHKMEIQRPEYAKDAYGAASVTWAKFRAVYGKITPLGGQEKLLAQSLKSVVTHNILIRRAEGVDTSMRIRFGSRIFEIMDVKEDPSLSRSLLLKVSEIQKEDDKDGRIG